MRRVILALCLGFATAAAAAPPPPPNPEVEAQILKTSCPAGDDPAKADTITVKAEPVPIEALEGSRGQVGRLAYVGGAKLTSDDPRFGDIIGLQFDDHLGLVAATGAGNWIILDANGPALLDFKSIKIAPMRGASGLPTALARVGQSFLAASHDGHNLDRYELNKCGLSAHAAPIGGFQGADHVAGIAPAAYSNILYAGIDSTGARRDLVTNQTEGGMKLSDAQFPAMAGYELINIAGPQIIIPYDMIGLWRRAGGSQRTRVQSFSMPIWSDILAPKNAPNSFVLADIPLPIRAVAGFYDAKEKVIRLYMVTQAGPKEPTYLLAFLSQSVTG
jgi:hypothetical protein